jgi:hypothetical protein
MAMQGKPHDVIVVAQARGLVGYLWAVLHPGRRSDATVEPSETNSEPGGSER